jgi:hypothetical protein
MRRGEELALRGRYVGGGGAEPVAIGRQSMRDLGNGRAMRVNARG